MKISFTNRYEKQFDRLTDVKLRKQIIAAVKTILDAQRIEAIPSIKKLKGFTNAYRVRSGQYRIGLIRESDGTILIAAIDSRKDFYRAFP